MIQKKNVCFAAIGILGSIFIFLFACSTKSIDQTKTPIIKIGAILPLTGNAAEFGKCNFESSKLVVEQYKKISGFDIQLYVEDSKSASKDGLNAYRALMLAQPDLKIISTELSSVSMSIAASANEDQLIMAIAATPEINKHSNTFRIYPTAESEALLFLESIKNFSTSPETPITVFYINDEYGRSVSDLTRVYLTKSGFSKLATEPFQADSDFKSSASKHVKSKIDIVIGYGAIMGRLIREVRIMNSATLIIASPEIAFLDVLNLIKLPDEKLFFIDISSPPAEVVNLYKTKYNRTPNLVDLLIYDGFNIILSKAIDLYKSKKEINGKELSIVIRGSNFDFKGRPISVDNNGNIKYRLLLRKSSVLEKLYKSNK